MGTSVVPKWLLTLVLLCLLTATSQFEPFPYQQAQALKEARRYEPIEVLILKNPLTHYRDTHGLTWGLDYERLKDFEFHSGLKLKIRTFTSVKNLENEYLKGRGRLVISRQNLSLPGLLEGPYFEEIENGIFCHKNALNKPLEKLTIKKASGPLEKTVKLVAASKLDCFESELQLGQLATQTYLTVKLKEKKKTKENYSWRVRSDSDALLTLLQTWYRQAARSGSLFSPHHRLLMTLKTLDESDIRRFYERKQTVLPDYLSAFQDVASEVNLPWSLLAAVAYQESQWQSDAVSFTGVKGLMQLTKQTAEHMGVTNREDPYQSIWGGSRYLKHLWNQWSQVKNEKDRLLITLASYNIGIAHMLDVIQLLQKKGLSPYKWKNIEAILPSLEEKDVFEDLKYGFARGRETVDFVNRSYSFYQILSLPRSGF